MKGLRINCIKRRVTELYGVRETGREKGSLETVSREVAKSLEYDGKESGYTSEDF